MYRVYNRRFFINGCENLASVNMPLVEEIGSNVFEGTSITDLSLPKVRIVGASAFANTKIKNLELPLAESLGSGLFEGNYVLKTLEIGGGEGWSGFSSIDNPFDITNGYLGSCTLYFPANLPIYDSTVPVYPSTKSITADSWNIIYGTEKTKSVDVSQLGHIYIGDKQIK